MNEDAPLAESLKLLARRVEERLSIHPEAETLLAHRRLELSAEAGAALEEHLTWCRDCAEVWRDLPALLSGEGEAANPDEKAADWKALLARLEPEASARQGHRPAGSTQGSRLWVARSVAATLAVALGLAATWIFDLSGRLKSLREPRPNVPIYDLAPPALERQEREPLLEIDLERGALLILNSRTALDDTFYEARILDEQRRIVWRVKGLKPTAFGNFTIELPRGSMRPGLYQIQIQASERGPIVGSYAVRVLEPSGGV